MIRLPSEVIRFEIGDRFLEDGGSAASCFPGKLNIWVNPARCPDVVAVSFGSASLMQSLGFLLGGVPAEDEPVDEVGSPSFPVADRPAQGHLEPAVFVRRCSGIVRDDRSWWERFLRLFEERGLVPSDVIACAEGDDESDDQSDDRRNNEPTTVIGSRGSRIGLDEERPGDARQDHLNGSQNEHTGEMNDSIQAALFVGTGHKFVPEHFPEHFQRARNRFVREKTSQLLEVSVAGDEHVRRR